MIGICVALIVLCLMWEAWEHKRKELSCLYCGEYRKHRQDCPYDFENREQR